VSWSWRRNRLWITYLVGNELTWWQQWKEKGSFGTKYHT
jgi:hypothetical protein